MKKVVYRREKTHDDSGKLKEPKAGTPAKVVLYCIVVTAVLYVLLIFIEKSIVNADDRRGVYVTVKEVPANIEITEINIFGLFQA